MNKDPNSGNKTFRKTMAGFGLTNEMMPQPEQEPTYPTSPPAEAPWPFYASAPSSGVNQPKKAAPKQAPASYGRTMRKVKKIY